jgi:serine/threonine-protein kinase
MEYVEGRPIDEHVRERKCSLEERVRLFRALCEAVQYAHGRAVIHLDIKPSNILVKEDGTPKLLDFGISKHLETPDEPAKQTQLRFTPAFAAPEQVRREPVGVYTDVYALGVILYELLAGKPPYDFEECTPGEAERIIISECEPEPPSASARRVQAGKSVWNDLDVLSLKALKKDIQRRYHSVLELAQDVDHYLKGEPLKARPDTLAYRTSKFLRRNGKAMMSAAAIVVLIVGLTTFYAVRLANARDAAITAAIRTQRIQNFMMDLFGGGDKEAGPSHDLSVAALLDRGVREASLLNSDPETQAELYETLGRMYRLLGRYQNADGLLRSALEKMKTTLSPDDPKVIDGLLQLGALRGDESQSKEAEQLVGKALSLASRNRAPDDPVVIEAKSALGRVLVQSGSYDKAIAILQPIVKIQPSTDEAMDNLLESLTALGIAEHFTGHYDLAESLNRRALALDRKRYGNSYPRVAEDLANIGTTEASFGRFPQAEAKYREAEGILKAWYGPNNGETIQLSTMLGLILIQENKLAEAEPLLLHVLETQEQTLGKDHPTVGFTLDTLGKLAFKRDQLDAAETYFSRALGIYKTVFGDKNTQTAMIEANLADVLVKERQYARAEPLYRQAVAVLTARPLAGNVSVGVTEISLGRVLLREKRYGEAEKYLTSGYAILMTRPSAFPARVQEAREDLATVYSDLKEPEKAATFRAQFASANARTGSPSAN